MKTIKTYQRVILSLVVFTLLISIESLKAQVLPDIARASFTTTPINGVKIKTNIPFVTRADMVSLEIKGYSYGLSAVLDVHLCFYIFANESSTYFYASSISSSGAHTPKLLLANENGKVVIFIEDKVLYQKLYLNAFSGHNIPAYYSGWTIVDEALTGTHIIEPIYKNSFKGDITFPGGKWNSIGNLGIGTDKPAEKLSVNGKIRAHEIKVETSNWPDYVFKPEYQLPSLTETEQFIKANGHLPDVPKAAEAEANGVSLGEMNKILLKKIEELTLHLIEKEKQLNAVVERLDKQDLKK